MTPRERIAYWTVAVLLGALLVFLLPMVLGWTLG